MSLGEQPAVINHELEKMSKISYTRDFLLSLSELDICKTLPSGFDQSIISEFEDASQDRQRTSGGLSLNNFRRTEYGSSPPNRAETNNYSRRIPGKREINSSGRSDKDSDSQSDKDSVDSGWRYGDQSRRSWQGPEHDGLLGSGSFPRPSGYATGLSASKVRANDHYQLNRSNEPYHPPRPYKAVAHPRRDGNDSYNHETFGSSDCTSEDRVEEERKRRASFELMRKEQHKAFEESHKLNPVKRRDEFGIIMQLDDSKDEKMLLNTSSGMDEPMTLPAPKTDPEKSIPSQTTVSRPLVPPGFTSTVLEKNFGTKSTNLSHFLEIGKDDVVDKGLQTKDDHLHYGISEDLIAKKSTQQMGCTDQLYEKTSTKASTNNTSEKIIDLFSAVDAPNKIIAVDAQSHETSSGIFEVSENSAVDDCKAKKVLVDNVIGESKGHSSSILEKLFGSALKLDGSTTNFIEHDNEMDGACSPRNAQSSKFARWFLDNDRKQDDDLSPKRSNELLSLIVGEKGEHDVADGKHSDQSLPTIGLKSFESVESYITSSATPSNVANLELFYDKNKPLAVPAILTCEAVEQSLMSKISDNDSALQLSDQELRHCDANNKHPTERSDNHASQHLLSLLQKGTSPMTGGYGNDGSNIGTAVHNAKQEVTHNVPNPGKSLTLETLFGSAFMKELQSVGAPVSVQRGSSGSAKVEASESRELSLPIMDGGPMVKSEIGPTMIHHDHGVIALNQRQQNQPDVIQRQWMNLNEPQAELDPSHRHAKLGPKTGGYDGPAETPLEEDSLIIGDSMKFRNFMSIGSSTKTQPVFSQHAHDDNAAIFNPVFKDERPGMGSLEGLPFSAGPYNRRETEMPHRNFHAHPSFTQLHPPQANNVKLFHHLESHPPNMNSRVENMLPEGIANHDSPSNHQFVANMIRPPTTALSGFDHSVHHPMMQQMQTSVNFPPQHPLQGLSRGASLPITSRSVPLHPHSVGGGGAPPQPNNQITGLMQELNPMQGFHIGQRLPNFSGSGMPSPAPDIGGIGNHPDAIQRLIQMGHRSNSKQIHPLSGGGHGQQGVYGHELNMGYGYR